MHNVELPKQYQPVERLEHPRKSTRDEQINNGKAQNRMTLAHPVANAIGNINFSRTMIIF